MGITELSKVFRINIAVLIPIGKYKVGFVISKQSNDSVI